MLVPKVFRVNLRRRGFLLYLCYGLLWTLAAACGAPEAERPHVFVFLVDTLRADHLGCYGYERPTSPTIDAFAADAIVFESAYTPSPWTRPAVASIFTGAPPAIHGVRGRHGWAESELITWAEQLHARDYRTMAHFTNGNLESRYGLGQGFDEYVFEQQKNKPYVQSLDMVERWADALPPVGEPIDQPIFSYLHSMDPHIPFSPRRKYVRPFILQPVNWKSWFDGSAEDGEKLRLDVNRYDGEIRQTDAAFGLFLEELKARDWYENSWIILVADHGEEFREHGVRGHGHGLWENLLRVPLLIRPPGGLEGEAAPELASLADQPVPIHAVADLVGGAQWADWPSLGLSNAVWTGLPQETLEHWIPTPAGLAPPIRRASFVLDGRAGSMVSDGPRKLVWTEFPTAGLEFFDLDRDVAELEPSTEIPSALRQELTVYTEATARGLRLRATQAGEFHLRPDGAFRGAHLSVGDMSTKLRQRRGESMTTLLWQAEPGDSILLERDVDQRWQVERADGVWVDVEDVAAELGLEWKAVGLPRSADELPPPMTEELRQQLKALGYLE